MSLICFHNKTFVDIILRQYFCILKQRTNVICVISRGAHGSRVLPRAARAARRVTKCQEDVVVVVVVAAVGCATLDPPSSAWVSREPGSDRLVVGCNRAKQTWHLTCEAGRWRGVVGNCTHSKRASSDVTVLFHVVGCNAVYSVSTLMTD